MLKLLLIIAFSISSAFAANKAVIIVDMQYGFFTRGGVLQAQGLINVINKQKELLAWAKKEKLPVLFFEYDGYQETDYALRNVLWGYQFVTITKYDDNGFSGTSKDEANEFLLSHGVDTLIFAGINACCCVKRTAVGALEEGYKIVSSADIVADINSSPPIYPQSEWFIEHENFEGHQSLESLLGSFSL